VDPKVKIRSLIDLKFIQLHCTNAEEYPEQRNRAPSPPKSPSSPTLEAVEKRIMRHVFHMEDQQSVICRFMMQMYHAMLDKTFMNDEELSSYLKRPGDRPSSVGGAENEGDEVQSDAGNKEAPVDNEAGVEKEPPIAPAIEEPAAASHADTTVEPLVDPSVSKANSPIKRADAPTKKADSSVKETLVAAPSRRSKRTKKTDSPLKEPFVAELVRRQKEQGEL